MDTASEAEPKEIRTKEHNKPSKKTFSSGSWSLQLQKGSKDVSNKKRMDTSKEPKQHPAASSLQQKSKEKAAREITKYSQQEMQEKTKVDDRMNMDRDRSDDADKKSKTVKNSDDNDSITGRPKLTIDCDNNDSSNGKPKSLSDGDSSDSDNEKPRSVENCDNANIIDKKSSEDCDDADEETKTEDEDPLNVDLYEKLCVENNVDEAEIIKWDKYVVGDDLQRACKWLSCSEKQFYTILMSIFAAMTFAMVLGLFILQAQMSMNSREMQSSSKKGMPQGMYTLYFDYLESSAHMPDKVDLRANTSIFVH